RNLAPALVHLAEFPVHVAGAAADGAERRVAVARGAEELRAGAVRARIVLLRPRLRRPRRRHLAEHRAAVAEHLASCRTTEQPGFRAGRRAGDDSGRARLHVLFVPRLPRQGHGRKRLPLTARLSVAFASARREAIAGFSQNATLSACATDVAAHHR